MHFSLSQPLLVVNLACRDTGLQLVRRDTLVLDAMVSRVVHVIHPSGSGGTSMCLWALQHEARGSWQTYRWKGKDQHNCNPPGLGPYTFHGVVRWCTCNEAREALNATNSATLYFQSEVPLQMPRCPGFERALLLRDPFEAALSYDDHDFSSNGLSLDTRRRDSPLVRTMAPVVGARNVTMQDVERATARADLFIVRVSSSHMSDDVKAFEAKLGIPHVQLTHASAKRSYARNYQRTELQAWLKANTLDRVLYHRMIERHVPLCPNRESSSEGAGNCTVSMK